MFEIELPIPDRSIPSHRLRVAHSSIDLPRGLHPDEHVVLRDPDRERPYLGRVVGIEFDLRETYYVVQVDGALTPQLAARYCDTADGIETDTVAALLRELGSRTRLLA